MISSQRSLDSVCPDNPSKTRRNRPVSGLWAGMTTERSKMKKVVPVRYCEVLLKCAKRRSRPFFFTRHQRRIRLARLG